ncbi:MAG TPA: AI-2E family transporter [Burkholderiales bacterium]|nr:AI-2E family transporter [Burkholderiales bacterium]
MKNAIEDVLSTAPLADAPAGDAAKSRIDTFIDGSIPSAPEMGVNVKNTSLAVLATIAFVFTLEWAQSFLIPLVLGIFISYTLNPLVAWLERIYIPRLIGTAVVMLALLFGVSQAIYSLRDEFQSIVEHLPAATRHLSRVIIRTQEGQRATLQKMQAAATAIEKAANQAEGNKLTVKRTPDIEAPPFVLSKWIWAGSVGAAGFLGQAVMVIFLVFFLLLSGDTFKRKLIRIIGPSIANKKKAVHILNEINRSIQSYMFMLLVTNLLLALLMWIAFRWIGLENAGAWAVASGLLHIIPYFGPLLISLATGITAFMQFESFSSMLLVSASTLAIATLVGTFVTTWMIGRIAKMNAAAVFISLLFWAWLWGIWGMLLGIPIIVIVKVIAEHLNGMRAIAELLRE